MFAHFYFISVSVSFIYFILHQGVFRASRFFLLLFFFSYPFGARHLLIFTLFLSLCNFFILFYIKVYFVPAGFIRFLLFGLFHSIRSRLVNVFFFFVSLLIYIRLIAW